MSSPWRELLPTGVEVGGVEYEIRADYRAVLDICAALSDPELDGQERAAVALTIFYPSLDSIPRQHYEEAVERCLWFIRGGGDSTPHKAPKLVDWEQDFQYIIAPINRVMGQEIRAIPYDEETNTGGLHWWTFLAAYYEIGECTFAQIVRIRDKLSRGQPLDKADREWHRRNRELVDFKRKYTGAEDALVKQWGGG